MANPDLGKFAEAATVAVSALGLAYFAIIKPYLHKRKTRETRTTILNILTSSKNLPNSTWGVGMLSQEIGKAVRDKKINQDTAKALFTKGYLRLGKNPDSKLGRNTENK